jgi:hypothetical protein
MPPEAPRALSAFARTEAGVDAPFEAAKDEARPGYLAPGWLTLDLDTPTVSAISGITLLY